MWMIVKIIKMGTYLNPKVIQQYPHILKNFQLKDLSKELSYISIAKA